MSLQHMHIYKFFNKIKSKNISTYKNVKFVYNINTIINQHKSILIMNC